MSKRILPFLLSTSLFSAPVGNPNSPAILQKGLFISDAHFCQPRAAYSEDYLSSLQLHCGESEESVRKATVHGRAHLSTAIWSIYERFDLSLTLGSSKDNFHLWQGKEEVEFQTSGGLVWFGDAKLILIEVKESAFNLFGGAGGWDWMRGSSPSNQFLADGDVQLKMRFWQAGAAVSQRIGFLCPYVGIAVFKSRWKISAENAGIYRFSELYNTGPVIGCSVSSGSLFSLNTEWRGWFENGVSVSGVIRF